MRCIAYGLVLIIYCCLLTFTEAQNKNYKKLKDVDNGSGKRYSNYREEKIDKGYKHRNYDINGEDSKINRYDKQKYKGKGYDRSKIKDSDVDSELTKEEKYSKYTKQINKYADDSGERPVYKRNKDTAEPKKETYEFKKKIKRDLIKEESEDDTEEEFIVKKQKNKKNDNVGYDKKKQSRAVNKNDENRSSEEKNKRNQRHIKNKQNWDVDEGEIDNKKGVFKQKSKKNVAKRINKSIEESDEDAEEVTKNKIANRKKILGRKFVVTENDSSEETTENDESDESDESEQDDESDHNDESSQNNDSDQNDESGGNEVEIQRTCKRKSKARKCGKGGCGFNNLSEECDETSNAPINKKKTKYSIKFAHEKQRINPSEEDNVMKKIHKEKKKYKYQDDDEDDSGEEHVHPKRFHVDEDEEE